MTGSRTNWKAAVLLPLAAQTVSASWQPSAGSSWQIVLSKNITAPYPQVSAIDLDMFGTSAADWAKIKKDGHKAICYFSAGSSEDWRPDFNQFTEADQGDGLDGWPGERWLNTKSENVRRIMKARMDLAVQRGCDAIDPDNTDVYDNNGGGMGLTTDDAIDYVTFLSTEGHKRGLAVGLKNSGSIVDDVLSKVDFQVNEQCVQYNECSTFQPFIDAGKPVFGIEYVKGTPDQATIDKICNNKDRQGFSTLIKHMDLADYYVACPVQNSGKSGNTTSSASPTASPSASSTPANSASALSVGLGGVAGIIALAGLISL